VDFYVWIFYVCGFSVCGLISACGISVCVDFCVWISVCGFLCVRDFCVCVRMDFLFSVSIDEPKKKRVDPVISNFLTQAVSVWG
jgi:hypothetical protein